MLPLVQHKNTPLVRFTQFFFYIIQQNVRYSIQKEFVPFVIVDLVNGQRFLLKDSQNRVHSR